MIGKKINKKIIPEEEDDNDLIINNDDDFYVNNDLKNSQNKNQEINKDYNPQSPYYIFLILILFNLKILNK